MTGKGAGQTQAFVRVDKIVDQIRPEGRGDEGLKSLGESQGLGAAHHVYGPGPAGQLLAVSLGDPVARSAGARAAIRVG